LGGVEKEQATARATATARARTKLVGEGCTFPPKRWWLVEGVHSHLSDDEAVAKMGHPMVVAPWRKTTAIAMAKAGRTKASVGSMPRARHSMAVWLEKSPEKLTQPSRIAIVRRFREYPGRAVGETLHAKGGEKPRSRLSLPPKAGVAKEVSLLWIREKENRRAS
jgi:hypothetical protein